MRKIQFWKRNLNQNIQIDAVPILESIPALNHDTSSVNFDTADKAEITQLKERHLLRFGYCMQHQLKQYLHFVG